ncbi:MAG: DNA mismatch repair endonuclease MutH [Gammaproteobacteria bacterium]|nr:DNA mismatch repair endonuclease MutH [Gammaproteobacteria bacterium]
MKAPHSAEELLERALSLAGLSLAELAASLGVAVPADLRHDKGWGGQLIELALGATAGSRPEPDFAHLGIELKTLPVDRQGRPLESTYVCTAPLTGLMGLTWGNSLVRAKLARVLWLPILAERGIPVPERVLGTALLWSPSPEQEALLAADFEEHLEAIALGAVERITARAGQVLQVRPKAANSRVLTEAVGEDGGRILTNPRGFYLRQRFTAQILAGLATL